MANYTPRAKTLHTQQAILDIFNEMQSQLTIRQIYYALTVRGAIPKTEAGYRQTCYHLKQMRLNSQIPYGWIADNTRWYIKPNSHGDLSEALELWQSSYRKDLWASQNVYVEIWVEKDALAGVISPVTREFDVPLYVVRGYCSMTFAYEAAELIKAIGKPVYIYHFGDYDPSGVDASNKLKGEIEKHGVKIHFERMAITEEQIKLYNLPTRETKRSDPRARHWGNKPSVELDALPAPILKQLVRSCITRHINAQVWEITQKIERQEQKTLSTVLQNLVHIPNSNGGKR